MRKVAQMIVAGLMVVGLTGCNSIRTTNMGNTASIEVTGNYDEEDAAQLTVGKGKALAIDPTIKRGSFVVEVDCNGKTVFYDDVADYDDRIYVPDSVGRCNVSVYTSDTEGKVKLSVVDQNQAKENKLKKDGSAYKRGVCDDTGYVSDTLGLAYPWPGEFDYWSDDFLSDDEGDEFKMELHGMGVDDETVNLFAATGESGEDLVESLCEPDVVEELERIEEVGLSDPSLSNVMVQGEATVAGGKDAVVVRSSWVDGEEVWHKRKLYVPRGQNLAVFECQAHSAERADELLANLSFR